MALYQVTLRGTFYTNQVLNVWSYLSGGTLGAAPSAFDLLKAMGFIPSGDPPVYPSDTLFAALRSLVSDSVHYAEVEARNLYSTTDFYLAAFNPVVSGTTSGIDQSPLVAYGLQSNRTRTDIRRGFKRFAGVVEEATTNGGLLTGDFPGALADVATKMGEVLSGDFDATYSPSVFSFEKYETPKGNDAYRPYPTEADQLEHVASPVTWSGYPQVRSQTSRQYNRGS